MPPQEKIDKEGFTAWMDKHTYQCEVDAWKVIADTVEASIAKFTTTLE